VRAFGPSRTLGTACHCIGVSRPREGTRRVGSGLDPARLRRRLHQTGHS